MRPDRVGQLLTHASGWFRPAPDRHRRLTGAVAFLVGAVGFVSASIPAAAINEGGTISFAGEGTVTTYPCVGGCSLTLSTTTAGDIGGTTTGGVAFDLWWSAQNAQLTFTLSDYCDQPNPPQPKPPFPVVIGLSGDLSIIGQATIDFGGVMHSGASVTAQFAATQDPLGGPGFTVGTLYVTVSWGASQFAFDVALPNGVFVMTPTSPSAICPTNTSTTVAATGTLLSAV